LHFSPKGWQDKAQGVALGQYRHPVRSLKGCKDSNPMPQSLVNNVIHLVFSTRDRQPLITDLLRPSLHPYLMGIIRNLDCVPIEVGGIADHVHLLLALSKNLALSKAVEEIKKSSSIWAKTQGPEFTNFYWQNGYGAFSVSASLVDTVRHYIRRQAEHHAQRSFQDELRLLLNKHGISFDERYLWD
jgi:REP element-mobilizing transposase RayT